MFQQAKKTQCFSFLHCYQQALLSHSCGYYFSRIYFCQVKAWEVLLRFGRFLGSHSSLLVDSHEFLMAREANFFGLLCSDPLSLRNLLGILFIYAKRIEVYKCYSFLRSFSMLFFVFVLSLVLLLIVIYQKVENTNLILFNQIFQKL